jgi:hypothetical protein
VEVGSEEITLRAGKHWIRFTQNSLDKSNGSQSVFSLRENGSVDIDGKIEEMDLAAESLAREMMQSE